MRTLVQELQVFTDKLMKGKNLLMTIGGSRGCVPSMCPPYGSRFFCFDMQNFWNVAASGVHSPPYEVHTPPMGNPGSATDDYVVKKRKATDQMQSNCQEKIQWQDKSELVGKNIYH